MLCSVNKRLLISSLSFSEKKRYVIGQIVYSRFECEHFVTEDEMKIISILDGICYATMLRMYIKQRNGIKLYYVNHGKTSTSFEYDYGDLYNRPKYLS